MKSNHIILYQYYADIIKNEPHLTKEEEIQLFLSVKTGDSKALDTLVKANLRLVITMARKFEEISGNLEDLISEGNIGLIEAIKRFDIDKGYKLSTYAKWWIEAYIKTYLMNNNFIRQTQYIVEKKSLIDKEKEKFIKQHEREPSADELSLITGYSCVDMRLVEGAFTKSEELDYEIDVYDEVGTDHIKESVEIILNQMEEKEKMILCYTFGIGCDKLNYKQIKEVMDIKGSTELIRLMKEKALKKFKKKALKLGIENFVI